MHDEVFEIGIGAAIAIRGGAGVGQGRLLPSRATPPPIDAPLATTPTASLAPKVRCRPGQLPAHASPPAVGLCGSAASCPTWAHSDSSAQLALLHCCSSRQHHQQYCRRLHHRRRQACRHRCTRRQRTCRCRLQPSLCCHNRIGPLRSHLPAN